MRCLIVGAGSIGIYLGCKLFSAGNDVTLLGRKKLKDIENSIFIEGKSYPVPNKIYSFPKKEYFDVIFVSSKLHAFKDNLKKLKKNKISSKYLFSIQNGFVDNSLYEKSLKEYHFAPISIFEGFNVLKTKLLVAHSKKSWKTDFSVAGKVLVLLLNKSKIKCSNDKNFEKERGEKMLMNCTFNVLSAIYKKTFYNLFNKKETREKLDLIFEESFNVINAVINLEPFEKELRKNYETFGKLKHYSSTYQDAILGKKSEINFLNGWIVKKGKELGICVEENKKLIKEYKKKYN